MARAEIEPGNCGFTTIVEAEMNGQQRVTLCIESRCKAVQKLAENLTEVDPYREISFRGEGPLTLALGQEHCSHTACPVPVGILKVVELAAGMAVPGEVSIKLSK